MCDVKYYGKNATLLYLRSFAVLVVGRFVVVSWCVAKYCYSIERGEMSLCASYIV